MNDEMQLNQFGVIARDEWLKTAEMRPNVETDEYMVMPNHMHGIIVINDIPRRGVLQYDSELDSDGTGAEDLGTGKRDFRTGTLQRAPTTEQFGKPTPNTIPTIIRGYKGAVTKKINTIQINAGVYNMPERIWQKNYYEHVIRNEASLNRIREYILNNPLNWKQDDYYLDR